MVDLLKKMKGVDLDGRICKYDKWNCIDIDPYVIYEQGEKITDPLMQPA